MKDKVFFLLFVSLTIFNQAKAMDEKEEVDYFQRIPKPLIVEISSYLYGKDFSNFFLTCKNINSVFKKNKKFFMPEEKEEILKIIKSTSFNQLPTLLLKWERADKSKTVPLLREMKESFKDFYPNDENSYLEIYRENFDIYFKILNILYGMGDVQCEKIYKNLFDKIESKFHNSRGVHEADDEFDDPKLYIFYYQCLALLHSKVKDSLIKDYQTEAAPFKKDSLEIKEWMNLPYFILSENLL